MTDSDTRTGAPPDAPPPGPEWKKIPGVRDYYEFSHRGKVRSLDHWTRGRHYEGVVLKPRPDPYDYLVVNITMADGTRKHGVSVARLTLLAHAGEPPDPEMQACHGQGGKRDNRWPENLRWDTDEANRADRARDHVPKPKPLKTCPRCGREHNDRGRRCYDCVEDLGCRAAIRLVKGDRLERVAEDLDYPSAAGLFELARVHGGLRLYLRPVVLVEEANAALREAHAADHSPWWLRIVRDARFKRGDAS